MIQNTAKQYVPTAQIEALSPSMDPKYMYPPPKEERYGLTTASGESLDYSVEGFFAQKQHLIDSKIKLLQYEIDERYRLKNQNLYEIDLNQCSCRYLINIIGEHIFDKKRIDLERQIFNFEEEKRREQTGFFRDILFLRKELRESLIERLEEEYKMKFLKGAEED